MSEETTRPVPVRIGADGVPCARTIFSPVDNKVRADVVAPPWTVVPIVFVPGIMGSNLKAKTKLKLNGQPIVSAGDRVWNVDSLTSPLSLAGKGAAWRQVVLSKDVLTVDNRGMIAGIPENLGIMAPDPKHATIEVTPVAKLSVDEARKRGWGTPGWGFYGEFLDWLQYQLSDGRLVGGKPNGVFEQIAKLVGTVPHGHKAQPASITHAQARKMLDIQFPVYAVGYNWLQSNLDSGKDLVKGTGEGSGHVLGIDEIIARHDGVRGQTCKQVIVVTHSMGGLVARAAALAHGAQDKILGIVHGVQPIDGAAAFYKRIAAGFLGEGEGLKGTISAQILGPSAKETIPELAYNPGPLELAPNQRYNGGKPWLFIKDEQGKILKALPEHGDPYKEIYLDTQHVWRAVNPEWLNPVGLPGKPFDNFVKAVARAYKYHEQLGGKLHPQTYAHWGADPEQKSWGDMTWTAEGGDWNSKWSLLGIVSVSRWQANPAASTGDPATWAITDAGQSGIDRRVNNGVGQGIRMSVHGPTDAGDGTVPAAASGAQIAHYAGCQIGCALSGFDHQNDYNDAHARSVLLDALVRLVEPVEVIE